MKPSEDFVPLDHAHRLLKTEVERAIAMFPDDECEAICELLRRSKGIPDLRRAVQRRCCIGAADAGRPGAGCWPAAHMGYAALPISGEHHASARF